MKFAAGMGYICFVRMNTVCWRWVPALAGLEPGTSGFKNNECDHCTTRASEDENGETITTLRACLDTEQ